jgi:hypothetical protein
LLPAGGRPSTRYLPPAKSESPTETVPSAVVVALVVLPAASVTVIWAFATPIASAG